MLLSFPNMGGSANRSWFTVYRILVGIIACANKQKGNDDFEE